MTDTSETTSRNSFDEPLAVSVEDATRRAGIGRTVLYEAIASGALKSFKVGKRRLIMLDALRDWLASHERRSNAGEADHGC